MNERPGARPPRPGRVPQPRRGVPQPRVPDPRVPEPGAPAPRVPAAAIRRTPDRTARREPREQRFPWTALAVIALLLTIAMYSWGWLISTSAVGVALIEIPLLLLLTTPLFMSASRKETRYDLGGLLAFGLVVRFAATYYRFTHAADGATYHDVGAKLAESYRHLDFSVDTGFPIPGTGGMRMIAGITEVFTNGNSFATFLVFAWLGFFACYLFYRAFVTALPEADHKRYALLIMLWPSLVFWPSSLGKDCWLLFTLAIASLGAAKVYHRKPGGYTLLAIGLVLGAVVRPHVMLMLAIAFGVGLLVGRRADRPGAITPSAVGKVAGLVILLALGGYLATRTADLLDTGDINSALSENVTRTSEGGSSFTPANPQNPIGYVQATVTVLVRPFPFEARGLESLVASAEAMGMLVLAGFSWRRLRSIPRRLRSEPYITLALSYMFMFIFAFGTIANFGILARQRSQLIPYLFVFLALNEIAVRVPRSSRPAPTAPTSDRSPVRGRPRSRP
ncbi:MAG: hypothetical protein U0W40_00450 [Acidimicrobiia bacterium]